MPGIIDITRNARLSYFTSNKSKFINVDKLIDCCMATSRDNNYLDSIYAITGIETKSGIRADKLEIKCFYGYYDLASDNGSKDERLYEFWTVNDAILIYAKEITQIPFECIRCFEDTDTFFATGFVEPIL